MAGLSVDQHITLAKGTLADLNKNKKFEMVQDKPSYPFTKMLAKNNVKMSGGTSIKRTVSLDPQGNARYKPIFFADDQTAVKGDLKVVDVPWAAFDASYAWDINEVALQSDPHAYVDILQERREATMLSVAKNTELFGWTTPTNAADTEKPWGVPYWLPMRDNADTGEGFDGKTIRYADGSTTTIAGGIDAATEQNWRPWAATYTTVDNLLLKRFRRAFIEAVEIEPPMFHTPPGSGPQVGPMSTIYTSITNYVELQELMDLRDDNTRPNEVMGGILARSSNVLSVNGFPVIANAHLNSASFDPFYFVDWSQLKPFVHRTRWMVESEPERHPNKHTVLVVHVDALHNTLVENRRRAGFVLHKVTS